MNTTITIYKKAAYKKGELNKGIDISTIDYFTGVLKGRWQDEIIDWRNIKDDERRKKAKAWKIPCVTVSGRFSGHYDKDLIEHSGLLCIDIDAKDNEKSMKEIRKEILEIAEIYAIHLSVSGKGLAVYFKIKKNMHARSFEAIVQMLVNDYNVIPDMSCSNVSRLRFVSYDPELYLNEGADCWNTFQQKVKKSDLTPKKLENHIYCGGDIDYVVDQIKSRGINIYSNYYEWLKIGFALANELGELGKTHFIAISQFWSTKHKTSPEKQYDKCVRRSQSGVTIATFFYYAKLSGIEIVSQRTQEIRNIAKVRRKQNSSMKNGNLKNWKEDTKKLLLEQKGIEGDDVDEIINKTANVPLESLEEQSEASSVLDEIETFLNTNWDFKRNEITGAVEVDGNVMDDEIFNDIYLGAKRVIGDTASKELVHDILHSSFAKKYNPIKEFIEKNKDIDPKGNILELSMCIHTPISEIDKDFVYDFLEKWLLSIIGSIYGTHSVMKFMLTGRAMGIGKSKFFQHLLPAELMKYFSSDPVSQKSQDLAMQMTQNILMLDDEDRSQQKNGIEMFKAISDKAEFKVRLPYGRYYKQLQRLAVFCGTSNSDAVIDDTDNRRIIPITVTRIDLKKFHAIDKTALFIEMYNLWSTGKDYFITGKDKERLNTLTAGAYEVCDELELALQYFAPSKRGDVGAKHITASDMTAQLEVRSGGRRMLSPRKLSRVLCDAGFTREKIYNETNSRVQGFWVTEKKDKKQEDLPF